MANNDERDKLWVKKSISLPIYINISKSKADAAEDKDVRIFVKVNTNE